MIFLLALSPIFAQLKMTPSAPEPKPELSQVLRSYTDSAIADAAAMAGITLYTEADAEAAIKVASEVAARKAVAEAVPKAVKIALKDVRIELWIWRGSTFVALCVAIAASAVAVSK